MSRSKTIKVIFKMNDYDFKNLSHNEFEALTNDLLSREFDTLIERFKAGKDSGLDGRFFLSSGSTCIVQSKHYANSGLTNLLQKLKNTELPKIKELNPYRYIVSTSLPLSPGNKEKIKFLLDPYIRCTTDIFGKEDINALIRKYPEIEMQYYKLWIASSSVLLNFLNADVHNASCELISQALNSSRHYAVTTSHKEARKILNKTHVIVITGEPGVGKTTLAEQLCLEFVRDGYEPIVISNDIQEGRSAWKNDVKQIFYFDDFLGKNCLETLRGNEDTNIMRFIERITTTTKKKFILTSRTNILDQGYRVSQVLKYGRLNTKEYILNVTGYSNIDKADMLYQFLWKSELDKEYLEKIIDDRQYLTIINHKNFNPRLVEFITRNEDSATIKTNDYLVYIKNTLDNPKEVWQHPYTIQLTDFSRAIVDLVAFSDGIEEGALRSAYSNFLVYGNPTATANISKDFESIIKELTRSFIKRTQNQKFQSSLTNQWLGSDGVHYKLFNPSIGDFIFGWYANKYDNIASRLFLFNNNEGLLFLEKLKLSNKKTVHKIAASLINNLGDKLSKKTNSYKIKLGNLLDDISFKRYFSDYDFCMLIIMITDIGYVDDDTLEFINRVMSKKVYSDCELLKFYSAILTFGFSYSALLELSDMLKLIHIPEVEHDKIAQAYYEKLLECWQEEVINDFATDNIREYAEPVYGDEDYEDYSIDENQLARLIYEDTKALFTPIDESDAAELFKHLDLTALAEAYYKTPDDEDRYPGKGEYFSAARDDVESIFEGFMESKFC